ncbi:hypothetical protein MBT84_14985 [Streptomyces sp. MBT84]|nr:hypothetical protein [Streptomyces sp. MBT84]
MAATHPTGPRFWFVMSIALCTGFLVALPMDWWLVDHGQTRHDDGPERHRPGPPGRGTPLAGATLGGHRQDPPRSLGELPCPAAVRTVPQNEPPYDGATAPPTGRAHHMEPGVGRGRLAVMTVVSFAIFGAGFLVAGLLGNLTMQ